MQPQVKPAAKPTLDILYHLIQDDLKRVDAAILDRVQEQAPLIHDVARHIIASGGKRIRPAITLISAQLCGYKGDKHIHLAAAVELLHTATLLHDDVVDESDLRRGLPTANETFGNKASILVGDFLLSQAFQLMVGDGSLDSLRILSDASAIISQGEVLQLMHQGNIDIGEEDYMAILAAKTAILFSSAAELGAVIAGKKDWEPALRQYGNAIGLGFQMVDDALDYAADEQTLGKTVGDDFREGKITLPVLFAYRAASGEEKSFWQRTMGEHRQNEQDLQQAIAYLHHHRAIEKTISAASKQIASAKGALSPFPESEAKSAMLDLADFCIARAY
jgi:octaprenyl-diphosphate synthase